MMNIELQVLESVTSVVTAGVGALVAAAAPAVKRYIDRHVAAKEAQIADTVIDGLAQIAESVVADFNQRVVREAKAQGVWTPTLKQAVKQDAVQAVLAQGANLAALAEQTVGNVPSLVESLVEQAVAKGKASVAQKENVAPQSNGQEKISAVS